MCKITIIDFPIRESLLKSFLVLNALQDNLDGFGYFLLNKKTDKTEKPAVDFLVDYKFKTNDFRGVYHVRHASSQVKNIVKEHSHPHFHENAVVFHNGTLTFKDWGREHDHFKKLFDINDTDSIQYTKILGSLGEITFEHIKESLVAFSGPFVLVQTDKRNPRKLWISRGRDRILSQLIIKDYAQDNKGKVIGTIFNTTAFELHWLLFNIMQENPTYGGDIEEVKENQTYTYEYGTFSLVKVGETSQNNVVVYVPPRVDIGDNSNVVDKLINASRDENLANVDLIKMFEILFGISIFDIPNKEILKDYLKKLREFSFINSNTKIDLWDKMLTYTSQEDLYKDLEYPFFINSSKVLKRKLHEIKQASLDKAVGGIQ